MKNTAYPFSNEEVIKYIEPNLTILITDSISKEKTISYHKELFNKKYNFFLQLINSSSIICKKRGSMNEKNKY